MDSAITETELGVTKNERAMTEYFVLGVRPEIVKVDIPETLAAAEEEVASKFPVLIENCVPAGFPFADKNTVTDAEKTWNAAMPGVTPGVGGPVRVETAVLNPLVLPPMPNV